ncbi:protein pitchfork-like isoform X3 [Girardinichthys multiradiatus]|uniref:protein pitchfork-like isoform X3 n=1 Tax=Girardinichthys multiradiatus TaxID=208333 RepID=UPI001FAE1289|nr:protein pitchfork-like isoform X3 [Girardinichthys multiradiatus]
MSAAPARRVLFGSSQDRKIFPCHFAPDRLGIQEKREETPDLGPGCYDNHEFNTIIYNLRKRPESKRGYVLSARTAVRFPPLNKQKTMTPSPQQYQPDQSQSRVSPPGRAPFMSNTHRFKKTSHSADDSPGCYFLTQPWDVRSGFSHKQESELAHVLWETGLVQTASAGEEGAQGEVNQ